MRCVSLLLVFAGISLAQSLQGVIDVHAHVDPETIPRSIDAVTLARLAQQEGMRAVVFKNHFFPTTGIAFLVHRVVPGIEVFGGIALNRAVGGMNAAAVEQMVQLPGRFGRIVWMPTMDSEFGIRRSSSPNRPFVPIAKNGELLPETKQVLAIIAYEDIALATGHISPEESLMLIREARAIGIHRIIVTHPTQGIDMTVEQQKAAANMGAFLEYCYVGTLPFSGANQKTMAFYAQNMKAIGPAHVIMSSDLGNAVNPVHTAGMRSYIQALLKEGMTQDEIDLMTRKNPAYLLGLK
ncbi:MAG TPA: DUF6282 family protein [Bryobacteraceae bacterium]|nr:DUF6282 family protein [Bryobacteraceae bacterium]